MWWTATGVTANELNCNTEKAEWKCIIILSLLWTGGQIVNSFNSINTILMPVFAIVLKFVIIANIFPCYPWCLGLKQIIVRYSHKIHITSSFIE